MSDERVVQETKGVTVELLATVDLGPEIPGMAGRQLRMRRVTHRDGVTTEHGPGLGWPEDRNTLHWLETEETFRPWRSRSTWFAASSRGCSPFG